MQKALLDAAEIEIDRAHEPHSFLAAPYDTALFHLLAASDRLGMKTQATVGRQENAVALDMIVNAMRYAVAWVVAHCPKETGVVRVEPLLFEDAEDLLDHARQYMFFAAAYSYWRRGLIDLELRERHYAVLRGLDTDTRYEAYDRLVKSTTDMLSYEPPAGTQFDDAIRDRFRKGHVLSAMPLDRKLVAQAAEVMDLAHSSVYELPSDWRFTSFDLSEFRRAMAALRAVVFIWKIASNISARDRASTRPWWPFVVRRGQLIDIVRDVSGLKRGVVTAFIHLLEYGSSGIRVPDPALQPLLPIHKDSFALSAMLLLGTSPERNLAALLNQVPLERELYARLVEQKEALLRDDMISNLPARFRPWTGRLPGRQDLPDIDLAILDDTSETVLLLELKWFIHPAEPREIAQRGEELQKGVQQCKDLLAAITAEPALLRTVGADAHWSHSVAVVSANSIGLANVQDADIPIIRAEHLSAKLSASATLAAVATWLTERRYLPIEGRHFTVGSYEIEYFGWSLDWYGIAPETNEDFLPL
jgi:hypothetical protein